MTDALALILAIAAGGALALATVAFVLYHVEGRRQRANRERTARMEQVEAAVERARVERAKRSGWAA